MLHHVLRVMLTVHVRHAKAAVLVTLTVRTVHVMHVMHVMMTVSWVLLQVMLHVTFTRHWGDIQASLGTGESQLLAQVRRLFFEFKNPRVRLVCPLIVLESASLCIMGLPPSTIVYHCPVNPESRL